MKEYPSIPGPPVHGAPNMRGWAFYKYDGSNLRVEWSKKRGWHKWGTRTHLFDHTDPTFGQAPAIFTAQFAEPLEKAIRDNFKGRDRAIAYLEFFGPNSFTGKHKTEDPKELVLIDVNVHQMGFIGPEKFLEVFGHLKRAEVVYEGIIDHQFIQDVRDGKYPVVEGVVCKGGDRHKLWMMKVKTMAYLAKIKATYQAGWEKFWE